MANNWKLGLIGHLDGTKSKNQLNQDINAIQKVLNDIELKAKLDPNQVRNLENQLNKLQVSLTDVTIPQSVLDGLVSQINNALSGIQIPNININPSGVGNAGKQIGEIISKEAANAIGDVTSKVIGQGFTVSPKMSQKVQSELENIVKDWTNGKGKISSITIDTKTDFNEQTLENIEHLKSATVQYSNELGQVITKTLKYKQIGVNTFANGETEAIKGWVESASTYKATLESTSKSTNNFVNQQKKAVTDLTNQVNQIYKSAIDPNASKPIKNSGNLLNLENQYNDIITAIGKMGSASEATFTDARNSVNTLISDLKIVVREYKNAETAATSMRSKDVGTIKAIKTNELDEFIAKIQNSKVPMKEMKSEIASLKTSLSNITDTDSLTAYLNQFDIASSKFKSLKEQFSKGSTVSSVIFNTSELEAQGKVYIQKVRNTIEAIKPELESKLRSAGYTDIEIKGVEKANGQIKSLTATVTDATGAFKQLNFQREKIQGKGKAQFGFVQTDDVKVIGTLSSSVEKVQGNLTTLKSKWEEQGVLVGDFKTKVEQLETSLASVGSKGELNGLKTQIETLKSEASTIAEVNKIQLSFDNGHGDSEYKNRIQSLVNDFEKYGLSVEEANKKTETLRTILSDFKVDGNFLSNDKLIAQADKLEEEFKAVKVSLDSAKLSYDKFLQPVSNEKASSLIVRINSFLTKNTAITAEAKTELQSFITQINGGVNLSDWNRFNLRLKEIENDMRVAGKLGKSLKQTIVDGAKSFAQWTFSSGAVMEVWQGLKRVYNESLKINDVMTDLAMSTDLTASQMEAVVDKYSNLGEKLNATTSEMIASGTEWIKQGQSIADTETLITSAMVLGKVGKLENAQATEYLTSTMKGYKVAVEDTMDIVDKLSAVDMASATNVGGLAEAMSQVANNANLAGVSMDKLLGYIAVIGETTGEGMSSVGTGLNAIFSRMGNIKLARLKDYQNNGEDLSNVETVLRGEGILLRDSANEFRNFGEVLDEVAERWTSFSEVSQRAIASAFAGTHHMEQFMVLMEGYGKATEYTEKSLNSSGEAMQKFEDYQKSVTAHTELFNKSIQDLARTAVDSGLVNFFIDCGTGLIKFLDGTVNLLTPLGALGVTLGGILGAKNVGGLKFRESHFEYA